MLDRISIGWRWLENHLNLMVDTINANKPLASASIAIEESPNGTILRVVGQDKDQQKQPTGTGGDGGGAQQPVIWHGVGWKEVTLIDPTTCQQTTAQILIKSDGGQIQIG